jgi:hypothetical protein
MPENAKPLKGIAPGVLETVSDFRGDTFRAVYTVGFPKAIYVCMFSRRNPNGASRRRGMKCNSWKSASREWWSGKAEQKEFRLNRKITLTQGQIKMKKAWIRRRHWQRLR